ncbi:MAG: hypothetical protein ACRC6V_09025 [Bacteroidales bacterium]
MTKIVEFKDLEHLVSVRNNHLNPLIRKVEDIVIPTMEKMEHDVSESVKTVTLLESEKALRFDKGDGGYKDIVLTPIMPEFPGIGVKDITGTGPSTGIKTVRFADAKITINNPGDDVSVGFEWASIFEHNQKWPEAVVKGTVSHLKSIIFTGDPDAATTNGENVTLRIPKVVPIKASIPDGAPAIITPVPISEIQLLGETAGSTVDAQGKLVIQLNAGGGGGITNQNFKGFFQSLGDIESYVKDPQDGKSYAFAKDTLLQGDYYTPYFYVNSKWQELKQDPALTYSGPKDPLVHGVFSIKPSDKIIVDANGQLNLDGLSTPQLPQYFAGFFDTFDQLKAEVTNPVPLQTYAFVKGGGGRGWLTYRAETQGSASLWNVVAPLGSFTFVDDTTQSYTQVFGIKKSDAWSLDSRGILEMKGGGSGPGGALNVSISGSDSQFESHDVSAISFNKGKSFAEFTGANKDHVLIDHPQRVINYNGTWESQHNHRDYEGNIYYDETARTWMGWGFSKDGTPDTKWTRIVHPHMSDEVRDLVRRVPAKSPSVTPGIIGDSVSWDHNGVTFLEQGSIHLPADLKNACGGYITTSVQDKDAPGISIPQYRIQTCVADRVEGGSWVRRYLSTGSSGGVVSWSPWVRTSFSNEDIDRHSKDPNAHKDVIKFHHVSALSGVIQNLHNQTLDGQAGSLRSSNFSLLTDNYGYINIDADIATTPYDGNFNGEGVIELSGYGTGQIPLCKWTFEARLKRKNDAVAQLLCKNYYVHTSQASKYPAMKFTIPRVDITRDDEIHLYFYSDNPVALKNGHPDLYIAPVRSYFAFQDSATKAGAFIGNNQRKLYGGLDIQGDLGVKVHPNSSGTSTRVYGAKFIRIPTDMQT